MFLGEAGLIYGVDNMRTKDEFAYFSDFGCTPWSVDWIDDPSCKSHLHASMVADEFLNGKWCLYLSCLLFHLTNYCLQFQHRSMCYSEQTPVAIRRVLHVCAVCYSNFTIIGNQGSHFSCVFLLIYFHIILYLPLSLTYLDQVNSALWTNQAPQQWDQTNFVGVKPLGMSGLLPYSTLPQEPYSQQEQYEGFQNGGLWFVENLP